MRMKSIWRIRNKCPSVICINKIFLIWLSSWRWHLLILRSPLRTWSCNCRTLNTNWILYNIWLTRRGWHLIINWTGRSMIIRRCLRNWSRQSNSSWPWEQTGFLTRWRTCTWITRVKQNSSNILLIIIRKNKFFKLNMSRYIHLTHSSNACIT